MTWFMDKWIFFGAQPRVTLLLLYGKEQAGLSLILSVFTLELNLFDARIRFV